VRSGADNLRLFTLYSLQLVRVDKTETTGLLFIYIR
jgi:hypothetical protein